VDAEGTLFEALHIRRTHTFKNKPKTIYDLCEAEPEVGGKEFFLPPNKRAAHSREPAGDTTVEAWHTEQSRRE